jgi:hypothetical protein
VLGRSQVLLEGVPLTVTTWEDSRIVATVTEDAVAHLPADAASTGSVKVVMVDERGFTSEPFTFELYATS